MKVSYYSPLPPSTSGIADYSALLLPALERLLEVEVVRPGRTRPVADADVALYHVGNDPDAHGWILDALRRRSGVVVLHDFVIHHLIAGATIGRNDAHAYLSAMDLEYARHALFPFPEADQIVVAVAAPDAEHLSMRLEDGCVVGIGIFVWDAAAEAFRGRPARPSAP